MPEEHTNYVCSGVGSMRGLHYFDVDALHGKISDKWAFHLFINDDKLFAKLFRMYILVQNLKAYIYTCPKQDSSIQNGQLPRSGPF